MAIQKNEYELSIWTEQLNKNGIKEEKRSFTIGANDMSYLGRATNVKLKREIKGTNTLTFEMPSKFFDSEKGEFVKNEFPDYLYNEAKVKLKFMDQYFEFYVKKITETKKFKSIWYSYECDDSFIDELSRTGYEIMFDEELYNNVDELGNFMEVILEDSIWDYRPDMNTGDFTEFSEQRFYKIPLKLLGGSIEAHPIELDVEQSDIINDEYGYEKGDDGSFTLDDEGNKVEKVWVDPRATDEKGNSIAARYKLKNPFTYEKRKLQYGDDLAREQRLFYDPYVGEELNDNRAESNENSSSDNGRAFLNAETVLIGGGTDADEYIYVPYNDLVCVYGNFIADAYKATETPAVYGPYDLKDNYDSKYALQPYSENPYDLIQFIYFNPEDEVKVDEEGYIMNNNCHYVIKIEDWNNAVKAALDKAGILGESRASGADTGYLHWTVSSTLYDSTDTSSLEKIFESIYEHGEDTSAEVYYSTNANPQTSLTDDFNWYPVYSDGILDRIGDVEVYGARKLSITDRTELNKQLGKYVKVYNNLSSTYDTQSDNPSLYSEEDLIDKAEGYRVCSSEETRIIEPTLARNLIQNGSGISDSNGWESRTQKSYTEYNTGSYEQLLTVEAKNTSYLGLTDEEIEEKLTGTDSEDESVSDFYLEITSPYITKCTDLSQEGTVSSDYVLNFGLTTTNSDSSSTNTTGEDDTKNYVIQKDKVYAIRLITLEKSETASEDETTTVNNKKNMNTELNRVLIGEGSINLEGNYEIQGEDEDDSSENYISFADLIVEDEDENGNETSSVNESVQLYCLPNKEGTPQNSLLIDDSYYHYCTHPNTTGEFYEQYTWTYGDESQSNLSPTAEIVDQPYLLFKSDKTMTNPYVGIKVESEPMTLTIENPTVEKWVVNDGTGLLIAVKEGDFYLDGVEIGINPITESYYATEVVEAANTLRDTEIGSTSVNTIANATYSLKNTLTLTDGSDSESIDFESCSIAQRSSAIEKAYDALMSLDLTPKKSSFVWKDTSSSTERKLFNACLLASSESDSTSEDSSKSVPHFLYLNKVLYGIFWLKRNSVQDTEDEEEGGEDE